MQTIRIRVNDQVYKNLMWFLNKFKKEELEIIEENDKFISVQEYLKKELNKLESGNAEFLDIDQLDDI